jgi:hypothetical protein
MVSEQLENRRSKNCANHGKGSTLNKVGNGDDQREWGKLHSGTIELLVSEGDAYGLHLIYPRVESAPIT